MHNRPPRQTTIPQTMTRDRLLLIPLLLWGLAMIAPDLLRVAHPLSSFGFYANNDGLVYDVTGPFAAEASSPAWQAGLPEGDRIDLSRLKCSLKDIAACSNALAALGGLQFVLPGHSLTIDIAGTDDRLARQVTLVAAPRPSNFLVRFVVRCCGAASSCYPPFFSPSLPFETTIFDSALGFTLPDEVIGLSYLVNGVLCFFVFEAVRSERVVSVWIPLRSVTILAFLFTAPTLFLRNQVQRVEEQFTLPGWAWLGVAVVVLFAISLLHDWAVDLADGFFNRGLDHHRASACRGYP